jgi:hypothetical protein
MPGFDRSGPMGQGPMTGGAFGYCRNNDVPDDGTGGRRFCARYGANRGAGPRRGQRIRRRGSWGYGPPAPQYYGRFRSAAPEVDLAGLHKEVDDVRAYLKNLETRLAELGKPSV